MFLEQREIEKGSFSKRILYIGSEEAIDFAVDIQKTLAVEAYRASVHLAKDRGSFKIYDTRREENNPFIKRSSRLRYKDYRPILRLHPRVS